MGLCRRFRRRQHSEGEPNPSPSSKAPREYSSQHTGKPVHSSAYPRCRQRPEREASHGRHAPLRRDARAGRLESVAVLHARRAHRLAAAAAEATVEMIEEGGVGRGDLTALEPPHQLDAAAWRVGLISGGEERRTSLKAKPAMHARVQPLESSSRHEPSVATTRAPPGSNVRRRPATSGPTPSRYAPK